MKIGIIGAGAVGGLLGARLAASGQKVAVLARGATLDAMRQRGLGVESEIAPECGRRYFPVSAHASAAEMGVQDWLIIALKQPALPGLARELRPLLGPHTRVLLAMNGVPWWFLEGLTGPLAGGQLRSVDPAGDLRQHLPTAQMVAGVVHIACTSPEPGVSVQRMGNTVIIGDALGPASPETQAFADLLRQAGLEVPVSDFIQQDIWYKLWGNMTMNPISALTGARSDRILDDPLLHDFSVRVMEEAAEIGARLGCPVTQSPVERNRMTRSLGAMKTSMLQDLEAGRVLEIEGLLGVVHELAIKLDMQVPNIEALLGLIRLLAETRGLLAPSQ